MPELAELFLAAEFINKRCINRLFSGPVVKAEIHKSKNIVTPPTWQANGYRVRAIARCVRVIAFVRVHTGS
jgi:hypothetical protein